MSPGNDRISEVVAWLRDRIATDRAAWEVFAKRPRMNSMWVKQQMARIEADTLLLDRWQQAHDDYTADGRTWDHDSEVGRARTAALEEAVRIRTVAYQHCPGFREEWRHGC